MSGDSAVIVGVGERQGIGAASAVLAAGHGLHVFIAGRTQAKLDAVVAEIEQAGGAATAVVQDCTREADIDDLFAQVADRDRPLRFLVYNTGRNVPSPFLKSDLALLNGHWQRCVLGAFLVGQRAVRMMLAQEEAHGVRGTIIYTGASASLRGKPMFAGFSAAKAGLRMMAQSMAREFGPQRVHVAHVVIDGAVDGALVRGVLGGLGRFMVTTKGVDGALRPDRIAEAYWMIHDQSPSAWTHELELRPYKEPF